jgi:Zn-dependent metalloprotease
MEHPRGTGYPDHYSKRRDLPDTKAGDWGGVHSNSSIPNNAWFLMTIGGKNDTSGIEVKDPIGWDASTSLWWGIQRTGLGPSSSFADAARASIRIARRLGIAARTVACAWIATGVLDETETQQGMGVGCNVDDHCPEDTGPTTTGGCGGGTAPKPRCKGTGFLE